MLRNAFQKAASANEALQTIGFFGGDKVVWLKGANFLGNDRSSEAERAVSGVENLLETLQAGLPPGVIFLVSSNAINGVRRFEEVAQEEARTIVLTTESTSPRRAGRNKSPSKPVASPANPG